eukprot:CAMPEP_0173389908 /NCGR_PEP_ID=MMETSP1356-20130122/13946_1 /TAXON_ID=77927 ORGANISM="Hemiselmis virescens, Strain PCC157" /NCGR_SAMPLE_ID=MMETSP1356 /ASSEMBLY_ACC=CAM_ASM_000847 /LENGTH=145 /DNA_ID=CAMNT_0014347189 /DNA_START=61 /DNA_END=498 /DNA_ORIENTATION=+
MSCMACCGGEARPAGHIDPKTFLANERTFISWLHMSVTLGSIATALVAIGQASAATLAAMQIMASGLLFTALTFCVHSMRMFNRRNKIIRRREDMTAFDDFWGPTTVGLLLTASWAAVFGLALVKLASNDYFHDSMKVWLTAQQS